jgi:hypothetical protein
VAGGHRELNRTQNGDLDAAPLILEGMKAPGVKRTSRWRIGRAGKISPQHDTIPPDCGVRFRDG